jgi:perosamine synthetase
MNIASPQPRFRMYTTASTYFSVFTDVLLGRVYKGDDCVNLEDEIKSNFKVPYAVCVPQARVGIYFAIKAFVKPGKKVVMSPYTIADVVNMVICAGGIPVFADVRRETCNIDPEEIEKLIDDDTAAVLVTHLHGLASDLDRAKDICRQRGIPLIEDAAQATGARFNGRTAGSYGDAGIFSFGRYKNLASFYGGIIVTPHKDIHDKIRAELNSFPIMDKAVLGKRALSGLLRHVATAPRIFPCMTFPLVRFGLMRDIGFITRLVETELDLSKKQTIPQGYLRRMSPAQARIVLSGLGRVEKDTHARIRFAQMYYDGLSEYPDLILPPLRVDGSHIYSAYPVQYGDRKALVRWLIERRRDVGVQHLKNCADLPAFKDYYRDCPRARATANEVILFPTYPSYTEDEVNRNIEAVRAFFKA